MFGTDQLDVIVERLKKNPEDRRCVLQMWSAIHDLDINSRDIPCNDTATFQIGHDGKLNLVVFCRSNDIVLGCYGANAVHFSFLLEYMAVRIGVPMGTYSQVSVNWHAYISTLDKLKYDTSLDIQPYDNLDTIPIPFENTDRCLLDLLKNVDEQDQREDLFNTPWMDTVWRVMLAHQRYRLYPPPYRFEFSLNALAKSVHVTNDWIVGATQWLERRYRTWRDH
jgi:hypothetical protein